MRLKHAYFLLPALLLMVSCGIFKRSTRESGSDTPVVNNAGTAVPAKKTFTKLLKIDRDDFVSYAKTLLGTPYKYGSAVPENGLDCSGFVTCVFGHFNVKCPRTSVSFTKEGTDIDTRDARPGDIILFTGSDNSTGIVGHMGIITATRPALQFIHSASGKNIGVILNTLAGYYKTHFVKIIRILE